MAITTDITATATVTPVLEDISKMTDEQLAEAAQAEEDARLAYEEMLESLALAITDKFTTRANKRSSKEGQWLRGASLYYGKLTMEGNYMKGETPFSKVTYRDRPDVNVVRSKCSIAIAQTVSMQFGTSAKNWDILPNKKNADPKNLDSCALMSAEIESQLDVTKYSLQCRRGMWDRVVLGTAILKGPLSTGRLSRAYEKMGDTNTWVPTVAVDYAPTLTRVNPWFFYPDETVDETNKINDTIETHPMTALELKKYMKHDGFIADNIAKVLEQKPSDYNDNGWADFAKLSENNPNIFKNKYLVLEYHGPITKTQLDKMEIDPCYDSINDEYYGEVFVCQGEVIRVELESIEASFRVPYYISVWEKDPGSVFGYGVPLMMEDAQRVVNESWHMILDNTSISSGPQVAMQKHLIEPANGKWELSPRQLWYLTDPQATVDQAIQFFNVPNVTQQIVPIMQMAQSFAEEESGIPLITAGLSSPETADTATGSLVMMQASTTLLDFMSEEWDDNITAPIIEAYYAWNMQNSDKPEIKGSFSIDVRTSSQYKNKQMHIRDLEKLSVESAQNPALAAWIKQPVLQRMRLDAMNLPSNAVINTADEVKANEEAAKANQQPDPAMMELQLKARAQTLAEAKLAFDIKQGQQQAIFDHAEKMASNESRLMEAQARVTVSQNDKEVAMLTLQQKQQETGMKLASHEKINRENNQTKAFTVGMAETRQQQEANTYQTQVELEAANRSQTAP